MREKSPNIQYAYCETVAAFTMHIRPLSGKGLKPCGGADTLALCGAQAAWDLAGLTIKQGVGPHAPAWIATCSRCRKAFEEGSL